MYVMYVNNLGSSSPLEKKQRRVKTDSTYNMHRMLSSRLGVLKMRDVAIPNVVKSAKSSNFAPAEKKKNQKKHCCISKMQHSMHKTLSQQQTVVHVINYINKLLNIQQLVDPVMWLIVTIVNMTSFSFISASRWLCFQADR